MARYSFTARDDQGHLVTGATDGASVDEIIDRLTEKGQIPVTVEELNFDGTRKNQGFMSKINERILRLQRRVPYRAVVFFTRQLATMISAGVPLARALEELAQPEGPVFKRIITQIADDISMGSTFSDAIAKHPGAFNQMYVAVVRSGEVSGSLDMVLEQMATYMENVEAMRQKIKAAMRYPMFISGFIVVITIGIMKWLVPTFAGIYSQFGAELPRPTRILIAISNVVQNYFILVILGIIAVIVGFIMAMTNDGFKTLVHKYILRFPVFGDILKKNIYAVFCRTLALLMRSGTPILQAIEICGAVVGNKIYAASLEQVYTRLKTGILLSQALKDTGAYPVLVTQLVATGEEAGRIDELLAKAAEFYEREIRTIVDSLASIIEPFLIIIIGAIVGSMLIALYMPIFMIGKLMQNV